MVWPPVNHQDVQDEINLLRDRILTGPSGTDDTARIQSALDAQASTSMPGMNLQNSSGTFQGGAAAPGGGRVVLGPGVWIVSNLILRHRSALMGVGHGTVIRQKAASTGALIYNQRDTSVHAKYCSIRHLTLDGNKAAQSNANNGIHLTGNTTNNYNDPLDEDYDEAHVIENVYVLKTKGHGIRLEGAGANRVHSVRVLRADGYGIWPGQDNHLSLLDIGWSGLAGMFLDSESCTVTNAKCWFSGQVTPSQGQGFYITGDSGSFSCLNSQDNTAQGYLFDSAYGVIAQGLLADSNSRNASGTYYAVDVFNSQYCLIEAVARNRFNSGGPGTLGLKHSGGSTLNDIRMIAAGGSWGVTTPYGASTKLASSIIVNGVAQT